MKKLSNILLAALVLVAAASCNKETNQEIPENNGKVTVLTAYADNGIVSKTTLDGVNVVWSASDVITAFDAAGKCYNSTETQILENGSIAKFSVPTEEPLFAVYPAYEEGAEVEMANGKITATIPTRQNAINNTFDNGANVEVAKITDKDNIKFKNVGGLVAVKVKGTTHNIISIKIADAAGAFKMTGTVTAGFDTDGNVVVDEIAEGESFVDLTGDITAGETYYAVIAPGIYEGVTITFTDEDGNTATYTKKTDLEVERNSNQIIGGFDIPENKWQAAEKYYVKVTSDEDIVAGDYLIVYETLNNDLEDEAEILSGVENKIGTVASSAIITEGDVKKIAQAGNEAYNVIVEEGAEGYTLKLGEDYLAYNLPAGTSSNNSIFLVETATEDGTEWALSVDGVISVFNSERYLQYNYNNGNPRFACYKNTQQNVSLYLLEGSGHSSGKLPVSMSFNPATVELTLGQAFTAPILTTNPAGLSVTYASSNTEVATVNETSGQVSIVAAGTATITATFAGNDEYKAGSASYTITVSPVKDYIFFETFDQTDGKGGNDGAWSGQGTGSGSITYDNDGWVVVSAGAGNQCAKFGASSTLGSATTPVLGINDETTATLTFKAGAWDGDATTLNISVENGGQASVKSVTLANAAFTEYTVILGNGIGENTKVKFAAAQASKNRFFLDEVKVVAGGEMPLVKEDPEMSFEPTVVEITLGETFTAPTLTTNPANLDVTYSASPASVATVNASTGEVTVLAAGTATITASFAGNDNYNAASTSYTLKVLEPSATIASILAAGAGNNKTVENVTVMAARSSSYVIGDGTGVIAMYYDNKGNLGTLQVGQIINVTGNVAIYNGVLQFSSVTLTAGTGTAASYGDPVQFNESSFAAWRTASEPRETKYIAFSGIVQSSGFNMTLGNETINIYGDLTGYYGKGAILTGYVFGVKDGVINFLLTSIEDDPSAPSLTVSPSSLTWESTDTDSKTITVTTANPSTNGFDVTPASLNYFEYSISGNTITVSLKGDVSENKNETITITHKGSSLVYEEVTLTRKAAGVTSVTDVLNQTFTGISGTNYTEFSGKVGTSGAIYAGQCAGGNSSIQLRSNNNNSGVVTTSSGGKVTKITVVWNSNTSNGRKLNVYGKSTAYGAATDLYNDSTQGTLLGTIVCGTSTELNVSGDYQFIGFRSDSGAMYLTEVDIVWQQ